MNNDQMLSWKNRFAVEMHPTGEVTEYTATLAYELLREGEEGRQKVDSVKFVLRAEGNSKLRSSALFCHLKPWDANINKSVGRSQVLTPLKPEQS